MKNKKIAIILIILILLLMILSTLYIKLNSQVVKNIKPEIMENNFKATYEIENSNDTNSVVKLLFESGKKIKKIVYPEDTKQLNCNGKKQVAIDYNTENNKTYQFKIKEIGKEEQNYKLVVTGKSQIIETQKSKYPIVTSDGVELSRNVDIDYQYNENCKNYYSLDGGQTWEEYIETIKFVADGNIKIKTETENNIITPIETKDIKIELANDAIGMLAYDNNRSTYYNIKSGSKCYMHISDEMIGNNVKMYLKKNGTEAITLEFYDSNSECISSLQLLPYSITGTRVWDSSVTIPENAVSFSLKIATWNTAGMYIYEIGL